jgi:putative peptidoglycan lipid II flippase
MTLLSRVLGLVRDIVFARFFGAEAVMDAFFVAFKIPNIFRRFFAEGAFSQAFVPVFAEVDEQGSRDEVRELIDRTAGTLGTVLFVFTAVGVVAAPVLIALFAPGFLGDEGRTRYDLAVGMLRLTFPYLLFISLTALAGAILNTYRQFGVPAFAPVLLNVVLILFAAWVAPGAREPGLALAAGVFAAGAVQLLFMLPFLLRIRLMPRPKWGWNHPRVRRVITLMAPIIFGASVAQINILFDTLIASFLATGSISWLYYSDRLMEFPLGVFGIALATVILPRLSRQHATESPAEFAATVNWALRLVFLIALPAAAGLATLAGPILTTIFAGGEFGADDVQMATLSLLAYSLGLPGFILIKVLAPGYFARQDTRTPVRIGVIALLVNMVLNVLIVVPWVWAGWPGPHAGLALATALSAYLNAGLLWRGLRRAHVVQVAPGWRRFLLQVVVATAIMIALLNYFTVEVTAWLEALTWTRVGWLAAAVLGGLAAYAGSLLATGLRPGDLKMTRPDASL